MEKYKIVFKKSVAKDFKKLSRDYVTRILEEIQTLAQNPRQIGSQKLSGDEKYRVRLRDFRILYFIEDEVRMITIVKIAHRKNVYKK